jgi:protein-disulfide isomerase
MLNMSGNTSLRPPVNPHDHIAGNPHAPVTLVEFGDYQCPYCGKAYPIVKEVQRRMGDRLCFVYRHFPLMQVHPYAFLAAETAEAAGAQGKFWPMHDFLFEHQQQGAYARPFDDARAIGLDMRRFEHDLNRHVFAHKVRQDIRSGMESGVQGTPTFFINGQMYNGSYDLRSLLSALEQGMSVARR